MQETPKANYNKAETYFRIFFFKWIWWWILSILGLLWFFFVCLFGEGILFYGFVLEESWDFFP